MKKILNSIAITVIAICILALSAGCADNAPIDNTFTESDAVSTVSEKINKYNRIISYLSKDCYETYCDKSNSVSFSGVDYYKVNGSPEFNLHTYDDILNELRKIMCNDLACSTLQKFINNNAPLSYTENGKTFYSGVNDGTSIIEFNGNLYVSGTNDTPTEIMSPDDCKIVHREKDMFIADVAIVKVSDGSVTGRKALLFKEYGGYVLFGMSENDNNGNDSKSPDKAEASAIIKDLVSGYNDFDTYFRTGDDGKCLSDEYLPLSKEDTGRGYVKVIPNEKYNISSYEDLIKYGHSIGTDSFVNFYISTNIYSGAYPVTFDVDGKKIETMKPDTVLKRFVSHDGKLYMQTSVIDNDCSYINEDFNIKYIGNGFIIADVNLRDKVTDATDDFDTFILSFCDGEYRIDQIFHP